jgi:hypothetical protein
MMNASSGMAAGRAPTGYKNVQLSNFTPEQHKLMQSLFSQVSPDSYISRLAGGDQSTFAQTEAPAMRQFQGFQGELASRFSGMGLGARNSSGFANTANQATSDFAMDLQSRRQQLQMQAIHELMGMSNQLLGQRPYENLLMRKKPSFWQRLGGAGGGAASGAIGGYMAGGPYGAALGALGGGISGFNSQQY